MLYCGHKQLAKDTKYLSYAILHWLSTNLNDVLGNRPDFKNAHIGMIWQYQHWAINEVLQWNLSLFAQRIKNKDV